MKKFIVILLALWALPLYAAMSDANAMKNARMRWGDIAAIGTVRCQKERPGCTATNWTKQVGISSLNCTNAFTVLGSGFNTWDAAFADADAHPAPIAGPLKGTVNFRAKAFDDVAVVKLDFIIDSTPLNAAIQNAPGPQWDISFPINTTLLAPGMHAVCATASDAAGNTGRSGALLFTVDQLVASGPAEMRVNAVDLRPSVSMPASIVRMFQLLTGRI